MGEIISSGPCAVGGVQLADSSNAATRGMVFTAGPIKPDVQHINPVAGFKRLFSMRSFTEFLKTLFKLLVVAVALVIVYRLGLQALMESSRCGAACVYQPFFRF